MRGVLNINYLIAAPSWLAPAVIAVLIVGFMAAKSILGHRRELALIEVAQQLGLKFEGDNWSRGSHAPQLEAPLFERKGDEEFRNIMTGIREGLEVSFFDYSHGRGRREQTLAAFTQEIWLPSFEVEPLSTFRAVADAILRRKIHFESDPEFAKRFRLSSVDPEKTRELFTPGVLSFLESFDSKSTWCLEGSGLTLIVYHKGKKARPQGFPSFVEKTTRIAKTFFSLSGVKKSVHRPGVIGLYSDRA